MRRFGQSPDRPFCIIMVSPGFNVTDAPLITRFLYPEYFCCLVPMDQKETEIVPSYFTIILIMTLTQALGGWKSLR